MKIVAISVCRNEAKMLPHFFRHYDGIVDEYLFFDNASTDDTRVLIDAKPNASVVSFSTLGYEKEETLTFIRNRAYRHVKLDADWYLIVDVDEFLWHEDLRAYLQGCIDKGITLPLTRGFNMYHDTFPAESDTPLHTYITRGMRSTGFDKASVVHRDVVVKYGYGSHGCSPEGRVQRDEEPQIHLMHMRMNQIGYKMSLRELRVLRNKRFSQRSAELIPRNQTGHWRGIRVFSDEECHRYAFEVKPDTYYPAWKALKEMAAQGDVDSIYHVALLLYNGHFELGRPRKAIEYFRRAAEAGHSYAQYHMGYSYFTGECVECDIHQAMRYFQKAAEQGHVDAQSEFAGILCFNSKLKDLDKGIYWLKCAADGGNAQAMYDLACIYDHSALGYHDIDCAMEYFQKAADAQSVPAMRSLAHRAETQGLSVVALKQFRAVAERSQLYGFEKVDKIFASDYLPPEDPKEAREIFSYHIMRSMGPV